MGPIYINNQQPLDIKVWVNTELELIDLGIENFKAYSYYKGMFAYIIDTGKIYRWVEWDINGDINGIITNGFTYPINYNDLIYKNKTYNFVEQYNNFNDVYNYNNVVAFPLIGQINKIYIANDTNKIYRWDINSYVELSSVSNISSGTYTPNIELPLGQTDIYTTTPYGFKYTRVNNICTISGRISMTSNVITALYNMRISIPINSNFTTDYDAVGVVTSNSLNGKGYCQSVGNFIILYFINTDLNDNLYIIATYEIK